MTERETTRPTSQSFHYLRNREPARQHGTTDKKAGCTDYEIRDAYNHSHQASAAAQQLHGQQGQQGRQDRQELAKKYDIMTPGVNTQTTKYNQQLRETTQIATTDQQRKRQNNIRIRNRKKTIKSLDERTTRTS
eukprot:6469456-Amphidinium_carterae.4